MARYNFAKLENIAKQLLLEYDPQGDLPVDCHEIAKKMGFKIIEFDNIKDVGGFVDPTSKTIFLNGSYIQGSKNFNCAHEIGHMLLHLGLGGYFHSYDNELLGKTRLVEWQANNFASALLMPRELLIKEYHDALEYCQLHGKSPKSGRHYQLLATRFNVSITALKYRLKNIGLEKDGVSS